MKIIQSVGFLSNLHEPLTTKIALSPAQNALKLLAGSVLIPLGLTEIVSAADVSTQKKVLGSGYYDINNIKQRFRRYHGNI